MSCIHLTPFLSSTGWQGPDPQAVHAGRLRINKILVQGLFFLKQIDKLDPLRDIANDMHRTSQNTIL